MILIKLFLSGRFTQVLLYQKANKTSFFLLILFYLQPLLMLSSITSDFSLKRHKGTSHKSHPARHHVG